MNACVSPSNLQLLNVQIIPQPAAAAVVSYLPIQNANINLTFNLSMDRTFHHVFNIARDLANYWDDEEMLTINDTISWPNFAAAETVRPKGTNDLIVISCHIGNPRADQLLNSEMWCCYLGCMNQTEQARPQEDQIKGTVVSITPASLRIHRFAFHKDWTSSLAGPKELKVEIHTQYRDTLGMDSAGIIQLVRLLLAEDRAS
ncbi:hypothetical protein DL95DRAFT_381754 [Leptodontidium sp. 2 PMI_412]|nr:hypothetical protein DL95DRAFT_381754 [Leptodontidium sp. 2 PMI_412]